MSQAEICPLCNSGPASVFHISRIKNLKRDYRLCPKCGLIFVSREFLPSPEDEKERYLLHNNSPDDDGYHRFLSRLADKIIPLLKPGMTGLDYGAGPSPVLAQILTGEGFLMRAYDPFFHPDEPALAMQYDFIVSTETAEHFHNPREDFLKLDSLLKTGGILGIMTGIVDDGIIGRFEKWHYKNDPTHVSFYSMKTMCWIASWLSYECFSPAKDIVIIRKTRQRTG